VTQADQVRGGVGRNASTLELFFDLVYVYAITQVVGFIHNDPTWLGLAKGAFLLGLLWWTWSTYTWITNWTGTASVPIKFFLLATMGTTLVMALAVPDAFGDSSVPFGITYFAVRILGGGLYWIASKDYLEQRAAFYTFFPISASGALLVLIGSYLDSPWLWILFIAGAAMDVLSAVSAGKGTWAIDSAHFAERNGLFVIIVLGESVVGIGLIAANVSMDVTHVVALLVSFVGVAGLWWSYFDHAAPNAEAHMGRLTGQAPGRFARDAYSGLHYPLVVGIVFFAVAVEDVVAHPSDPMTTVDRFAMAAGVALVLLSVVAITYRAVRLVAFERLVAAIVLTGLVWLTASLAALAFAVLVVAILIVTLALERDNAWPEPS
jgi:low temperature requirement protein LtrA